MPRLTLNGKAQAPQSRAPHGGCARPGSIRIRAIRGRAHRLDESDSTVGRQVVSTYPATWQRTIASLVNRMLRMAEGRISWYVLKQSVRQRDEEEEEGRPIARAHRRDQTLLIVGNFGGLLCASVRSCSRTTRARSSCVVVSKPLPTWDVSSLSPDALLGPLGGAGRP